MKDKKQGNAAASAGPGSGAGTCSGEPPYADYGNCLVNLACSIRREFGVDYGHPTMAAADRRLKEGFRNVVVLLLDGMGSDALRCHLKPEGFFRSHLETEYSSVFPPTTTAATISMESGQTPAEHGWLGWSLYFPELDRIVDALTNCEEYTGKMAADFHAAGRFMPYDSICAAINKRGGSAACRVSRFGDRKVETFQELCGEIKRLCGGPGRHYVYAYWESPDDLMHRDGCYARSVTECLRELEGQVQELVRGLGKDTLLFVTADHGHRNMEKYYVLSRYPELTALLERPIALEPRAAAFYVKPGCQREFSELFRKNFGDDFRLFTGREALDAKLFGPGREHERLPLLAGDFLAVALGDRGFAWDEHARMHRSHHAGATLKERSIPLLAVCGKIP